MDQLLSKLQAFLAKEPSIVWVSGGTALAGVIQADPYILPDWKNYITLGISFGIALIIRQAVTPTK